MHGLWCRIQYRKTNNRHHVCDIIPFVTVCFVCMVHGVRYSRKRLIDMWHYTSVTISFVSMIHDVGLKNPTYLWHYQCDRCFCMHGSWWRIQHIRPYRYMTFYLCNLWCRIQHKTFPSYSYRYIYDIIPVLPLAEYEQFVV